MPDLIPLHTNPFDLSAHLEDDHEIDPLTLAPMDSDELRRMHRLLHRWPRLDHEHPQEDSSV